MELIHTTPLAVLDRSDPDLLVVRFNTDAPLEEKGIAELITLRRQLTQDQPIAVMAVFPEKVDLQPNAVSNNHYREPGTHLGLRALAIVATSPFLWSMGELFLRYYPQPFPADVFRNEEDARAWLANPTMRPDAQ
jgi:hypothetical protein